MGEVNQNGYYTPEFKASAVKLALESDQPYTQTARELGLNKSTLYTWISNLKEKDEKSSSIKADSNAEIIRLKAENRRLKEEREILKKAAAYFARSLK